MELDFEPTNGNYIIKAENTPGRVAEMKDQFGLDFWPGASTAREAVFSTKQPYAAAPFWSYANPRAKADHRLQWICREIALSQAADGAGHYDVPEGQELAGYQKADLAYMLARKDNGGVLDADEPGLGKTPTSIAYANEIRARRVLIICPASIRMQWLERWAEWTTMPNYLPGGADMRGYAVMNSRLGVDPSAAVTAVSYQLASAKGIHEALMQQSWDLCIIDEAHFLKTPSAARTRAIFGGDLKRRDEDNRETKIHTGGLASKSKRIVALTGTPLPNRPREAHVLASNLCPEAIDFLSENAFGERFNPRELREVEVWDDDLQRNVLKYYNDESSGRHAELQARLRAHFMCRHLKREVLGQLKLPVYDLVRAEETTAVRAALRAESLLQLDPDTLTGAHADIIGDIATARLQMGLALAPQAAHWCKDLLDGGVEKIVIFYWHIEVGNLLEAVLSEPRDKRTDPDGIGYGICRVDGRSTPVVKEAQKNRFRTDPRYRVMMGNVLSLGTGTDGLQDVSSYAFIAEPDWVPANNVQCVDRLDRRGQTQTVNADILVAPGSIAERVLASALRKAKVTHSALDRRVA